MRGRAAVAIALSDEERVELEMRARRRKTARADAQRAAIVLLAAAGEVIPSSLPGSGYPDDGDDVAQSFCQAALSNTYSSSK